MRTFLLLCWTIQVLLASCVALPKSLISKASGVYNEGERIYVEGDDAWQIRYTINGAKPTHENPIFPVNGLILSESLLHQSCFKNIPTTLNPNVWQKDSISEPLLIDRHWEKTDATFARPIILRVAAFINDSVIAEDYGSYFPKKSFGTLPIVSLLMDSNALFNNDTGIYLPGKHVVAWNSIWTGNYHENGRDWERLAMMEFFDRGVSIQKTAVGVRIHGLKSGSAPQKSLRLYARKNFGEKRFSSQFFGSFNKEKRSKRLVLRTPQSAHRNALLTDPLCVSLTEGMHFDKMSARPCVLYLNGEYWGIHYIRERIDKHFIAQHHSVMKDQNFMNWGAFGAAAQAIHKSALREDSLLVFASEKFDLENLTDYVLANTYFRNLDWLDNNNNTEFWLNPNDHKWYLFFVDADAGLFKEETDMFAFMKKYQHSLVSKVFLKLMETSKYRARFKARYLELTNNGGQWYSEKALLTLQKVKKEIEPEVPQQSLRWKVPESISKWESDLGKMSDFLQYRSEYVDTHLNEHFNLGIDRPKSKSNYFVLYLLGTVFVVGAFLLIKRTNVL